MARQVKRGFKYRFYPTDEQAAELSRTFGCVRLVCNKALEERIRAWCGEQRDLLCAVLRRADRVEEERGTRLFDGGVFCSAAAGAAASADGVRSLFCQAGEVLALQVAEEVACVGRVPAQCLHVARGATDAGEDGAAPGDPLVAAAARGCGADHGDRVPGCGGKPGPGPASRGQNSPGPRHALGGWA